jgi:hypothetical protein
VRFVHSPPAVESRKTRAPSGNGRPRALLGLARLAAALVALAPGGCVRRSEPSPAVLAAGNAENALWIQSSYLRGYRPSTGREFTEDDVLALARLLRENHIRNAYLFAGPFDRDGKLPAYATAPLALQRIELLRREAPEVRILPWFGGLERKEIWLEDPRWADAAIAETARALRVMGANAVHVNFEYLLFGREPDPSISYAARMQSFFERLRAALPGTFISTVVPSTAPDTIAWKYKHSEAEVRRLLPYVDQLAVLYYDTHLRDEALFERNMGAQLDQFTRWRGTAPRIELLLAAGTFVNRGAQVQAYRELSIENPENHLRVLRHLLLDSDGARAIDGIAIYCDWETDASEWATLRREWFDFAR